MRRPASRSIVILLALFVAALAPRVALADARSDARAHYQAGVKAYGSGDFRAAIKEFSTAQQLAPADLNNYNLALCYDKLGEAEPAIQYYRAFLDKQPNADKRAEIEASIARLEGALKSAAAKRAEEQRLADEARKADEAKRAEEARKADEAKRAEQAQHTEAAGTADEVKSADDAAAAGTTGGDVATGVGSTGTPSTGQAVSTGDAQLDRVAAIDINGIRDQRTGAGGSGIPDPRGGPATAQAEGAPTAQGTAGAQAPNGPQGAAPATAPTDEPQKKETPVYKKWWFWAVVAVSAYVVYSIASEDSNSGNQARTLPQAAPAKSGFTLLRF